jgi:hypothetical protein
MKMEQNHYARLFFMSLVSLVAMCFLMYSMINAIDNFITT